MASKDISPEYNMVALAENYYAILASAKKHPKKYIPVFEFLDMTDRLAVIIGKLMKIKVVQNDMMGNAGALRELAKEVKADTLQEALLKEKDMGRNEVESRVLWLNRAIKLAAGIIDGMADPKKPFKAAVIESYEKSLSKYHGKIVKGIAKFAMNFVPKNEKVIAFALKNSGKEKPEEIYPYLKDMSKACDELSDIVLDFYKEAGFPTETGVN